MSDPTHIHLFLDCSGPGVQIGLLRKDGWIAYRKIEGSALEVLFDGVQNLLRAETINWSDIHGILFCEGPGSLLSLRIGAVAVQTWYQTSAFAAQPQVFPLMPMAGHLLALRESDFLLVAPGRKGEWHCIEFQNRVPVGAPQLVKTSDIPKYDPSRSYWIPHRELSSDLTYAFTRWHPDWSQAPQLWSSEFTAPLIQTRPPSELLNQEQGSTYARWSGAIHQK